MDSNTADIDVSDPYLTQFHNSKILWREKTASNLINTTNKEIYGTDGPIAFRIGNGGAGYTGVIQVLAEAFIKESIEEDKAKSFRIGWVANHSRHTLVALLGDIVQVALTYEPDNEDLAIQEGWGRRVCRVFNDHFVLAGPDSNPARIDSGADFRSALREIASAGNAGEAVFHSRGDGSATFAKEQQLYALAEVETVDDRWIKTLPAAPYQALLNATAEEAYLVTDRATFLKAKRDGVIPELVVYVESEPELLNPCAAMIRTDCSAAAASFAAWLGGDQAQAIIRDYGKSWNHEMPLFTVAKQEEFEAQHNIAGMSLL